MGSKTIFFEALGGETPVGLFTHSTTIGTGVDVHASQLGIGGACQGPTGDGVQGFSRGSASGVSAFGRSAALDNGGAGVSA